MHVRPTFKLHRVQLQNRDSDFARGAPSAAADDSTGARAPQSDRELPYVAAIVATAVVVSNVRVTVTVEGASGGPGWARLSKARQLRARKARPCNGAFKLTRPPFLRCQHRGFSCTYLAQLKWLWHARPGEADSDASVSSVAAPAFQCIHWKSHARTRPPNLSSGSPCGRVLSEYPATTSLSSALLRTVSEKPMDSECHASGRKALSQSTATKRSNLSDRKGDPRELCPTEGSRSPSESWQPASIRIL